MAHIILELTLLHKNSSTTIKPSQTHAKEILLRGRLTRQIEIISYIISGNTNDFFSAWTTTGFHELKLLLMMVTLWGLRQSISSGTRHPLLRTMSTLPQLPPLPTVASILLGLPLALWTYKVYQCHIGYSCGLKHLHPVCSYGSFPTSNYLHGYYQLSSVMIAAQRDQGMSL